MKREKLLHRIKRSFSGSSPSAWMVYINYESLDSLESAGGWSLLLQQARDREQTLHLCKKRIKNAEVAISIIESEMGGDLDNNKINEVIIQKKAIHESSVTIECLFNEWVSDRVQGYSFQAAKIFNDPVKNESPLRPIISEASLDELKSAIQKDEFFSLGGNKVLLVVDSDAPNALLFSAFDRWLREMRRNLPSAAKTNGPSITNERFTDYNFGSWSKTHRIIQLCDIEFWSLCRGRKMGRFELARHLFPEDLERYRNKRRAFADRIDSAIAKKLAAFEAIGGLNAQGNAERATPLDVETV